MDLVASKVVEVFFDSLTVVVGLTFKWGMYALPLLPQGAGWLMAHRQNKV